MVIESKIILASSSPRRVDLLKQIQIEPYKIIPHNINEKNYLNLPPTKMVKKLSYEKAMNIKKKVQNNKLVISADTAVARGNKIFEKTNDKNLVKEYLNQLSGKKHIVYGGICAVAPDGSLSTKVVKTEVFFRRLFKNDFNDKDLINEGIGKAGGYAIQGYGASLVSKIKGSYFNVVGLSIFDVLLMLKGLGWTR